MINLRTCLQANILRTMTSCSVVLPIIHKLAIRQGYDNICYCGRDSAEVLKQNKNYIRLQTNVVRISTVGQTSELVQSARHPNGNITQ